MTMLVGFLLALCRLALHSATLHLDTDPLTFRITEAPNLYRRVPARRRSLRAR